MDPFEENGMKIINKSGSSSETAVSAIDRSSLEDTSSDVGAIRPLPVLPQTPLKNTAVTTQDTDMSSQPFHENVSGNRTTTARLEVTRRINVCQKDLSSIMDAVIAWESECINSDSRKSQERDRLMLGLIDDRKKAQENANYYFEQLQEAQHKIASFCEKEKQLSETISQRDRRVSEIAQEYKSNLRKKDEEITKLRDDFRKADEARLQLVSEIQSVKQSSDDVLTQLRMAFAGQNQLVRILSDLELPLRDRICFNALYTLPWKNETYTFNQISFFANRFLRFINNMNFHSHRELLDEVAKYLNSLTEGYEFVNVVGQPPNAATQSISGSNPGGGARVAAMTEFLIRKLPEGSVFKKAAVCFQK